MDADNDHRLRNRRLDEQDEEPSLLPSPAAPSKSHFALEDRSGVPETEEVTLKSSLRNETDGEKEGGGEHRDDERNDEIVRKRLNDALLNQEPLARIRSIVERHPWVLSLPDRKRFLPSLLEEGSLGVEDTDRDGSDDDGMSDRRRDAEARKNPTFGFVPLLKAVYYRCDKDVVLYLARASTATDADNLIPLILKETPFYRTGRQQRQIDHDAVALLQEMIGLYRHQLLEPICSNCASSSFTSCFVPGTHDLPLHYVLRNDFPYEVVEALLDAEPSALRIENNYEELPLTVACKNRRLAENDDDEMLRRLRLLVRHPETVTTKSGVYDSLEHLVNSRGGPKSVRFLLERAFPSLGRVAGDEDSDDNFVPIHATFDLYRRADFQYRLAQLFPDTLSKVSGSGRSTAMHLLCQLPFSLSDFPGLVSTQSGRAALEIKDADGQLPLHQLSYSGFSCVGAGMLLNSYPDAIRVADSRGNLPLHAACSQTRHNPWYMDFGGGPSGEAGPITWLGHFIQYLADRCPDALQERNLDGFLPLHLAVQHGQVLPSVIQHMVERHPKSANTPVVLPTSYRFDDGGDDGGGVAVRGAQRPINQTEVDDSRENNKNGNERWFPALLAAKGYDGCHASNLEAVYYLVRRCPDVLYNNYVYSAKNRQKQTRISSTEDGDIDEEQQIIEDYWS